MVYRMWAGVCFDFSFFLSPYHAGFGEKVEA